MATQNSSTTVTPWLTSNSRTWKRVSYAAVAPTGGVRLADEGLFKAVMERNVQYLLADWRSNVDDMLHMSRLSAGMTNPPGQLRGWDTIFPGHAASFLLGAGSTLQWQERPELRSRLNQVIEGLKGCVSKEGGLKTPLKKAECAGYSITLFAHGLMTAGLAGNKDAWDLLAAAARQYRTDVEQATARDPAWAFSKKTQDYFGVSASALEALSPVGVNEDIECALKHTHPGWTKQLADRDPAGIWQCPISWPHSAETYGFVGYLDLYRATGDQRLLDAMVGAWELMRDQWQHPGGAQAICEHDVYPPRSYHITPQAHTGELCSNVWWIRFSHKLHQLFPMQERYANDIEKCIYNVGMANQDKDSRIKYHANLEGNKTGGDNFISCCEVLGTYLYGSLPEYIYSIADDGLFVNLYEPSSIAWKQGNQSLQLTMESRFPFRPEVALRVKTEKSVAVKLRVRTPAWAARDMPILVNGQQTAIGKPGSYVVLDRTWADGDRVEFTLPMDFRLTLYEGVDRIPGHKRYSIMYGPILMAAAGPLDPKAAFTLPHSFKSGPKSPNVTYLVRIAHDPAKPQEWLKPRTGQDLSFDIEGQTEPYLTPYWQVEGTFTCFPVIER